MVAPRKRARTKKGEFRGDNPSTPNINEAWEETPVAKKAPAKETTAKKDPVKKSKVVLPPPWSALYKAMIIRGEIKE
tara:strand:+ start:28 stop:258 length:231 start_codon:yes stop_codon:yes gene_type:complete